MPGVPWRVEFSKIFKFFFFKILKCPKSFPKVSKRVLDVFWGKLSKKFCPVFHRRSSLRKFSKNQKICKIPKMPKIVPKSIQTCFELVLGQIFRKIFLPSVPRRVEFSKNFLQIKKLSKFKNAQNRSQRSPNMFSTCFGANFSKNFCPVFNGMSSVRKFSKKKFKIPKMPKSVPKSIQTCFRVIFSKKIYARCSMEGRVFENFQNFFFKIPKMPKILLESIQACFERVLGQIFRIFFCPVFHGGSSFRKFS